MYRNRQKSKSGNVSTRTAAAAWRDLALTILVLICGLWIIGYLFVQAARADGTEAPGIYTGATAHSLGYRIEPPTPYTEEARNTVPPPPVFTWTRYDCWSFVPLLEKYGIPIAWGMRVMYRESRCDPDVRCNINEPCRSPVDDSLGLFQINVKGYLWSNPGGRAEICGLEYKEQLFDPETNVRCASIMYSRSGKAPWGG